MIINLVYQLITWFVTPPTLALKKNSAVSLQTLTNYEETKPEVTLDRFLRLNDVKCYPGNSGTQKVTARRLLLIMLVLTYCASNIAFFWPNYVKIMQLILNYRIYAIKRPSVYF